MLSDLDKEVKYRTSRSGGAGGQSVNKVATKVELLFEVEKSMILSDEQKTVVLAKLKNRISSEGLLILQCSETRSQLKNKGIVFNRFIELLKETLKPKKKRKPTKPSKSSVKRRLKSKKIQSDKKQQRRYKGDDG